MPNHSAIQRELPWDEDQSDRELFASVRDAVDEVGFKEVLFTLQNVDRTTLANRIACRDGREPHARELKALIKAQTSGELLRHLCASAGYAMPERLVEQKPEEKLRILIDAVRKEHGAAGERTIAKAFGGGGI